MIFLTKLDNEASFNEKFETLQTPQVCLIGESQLEYMSESPSVTAEEINGSDSGKETEAGDTTETLLNDILA